MSRRRYVFVSFRFCYFPIIITTVVFSSLDCLVLLFALSVLHGNRLYQRQWNWWEEYLWTYLCRWEFWDCSWRCRDSFHGKRGSQHKVSSYRGGRNPNVVVVGGDGGNVLHIPCLNHSRPCCSRLSFLPLVDYFSTQWFPILHLYRGNSLVEWKTHRVWKGHQRLGYCSNHWIQRNRTRKASGHCHNCQLGRLVRISYRLRLGMAKSIQE